MKPYRPNRPIDPVIMMRMRLWNDAYITAIAAGNPNKASARCADKAVEEFNERFAQVPEEQA